MRSTAGGALLGTWEYMVPEQWLDSNRVDFKVDVHALGILWFQLLAGQLPYGGSELQSLMLGHVGLPPPLQWLEPHAPASVRELVGRTLSKNPSERPELSEVLDLLSTLGD
ncbi:protein kinase [Myxococcus sp. AB056]|uniref:protein kinase domain-containing protein n=1 Tax=Myxococcus sp. AB056 TaxID=2562792 RepID=UPI0018916C9D|nr:protein kinase [Myxococcus sp. AB056]